MKNRLKKKVRNFCRKNLLRFLGYIILSLSLFLGGLQIFQYSKNFLAEQENRKTENFALLQELQKTQMQMFTSCQNENKIKRYLLLAEDNCQNFLGEKKALPEKNSLPENFLSFFHLFFVEENNFPQISKEMKTSHVFTESELETHTEKSENNKVSETSEEDQKKNNTQKNRESDSELNFFSQDPHITQYLKSFGYLLLKEKSESDTSSYPAFSISEKTHPEKILARISFNEEKQQIYASLFQGEEIYRFPLKTFISERKILDSKFAGEKSNEILAELKNIDISSQNNENILIVGHNEGNTDTIILAAIDHSRKKITMISIPRDLWIHGRRINAFRLKFGQSIFLQQIEKISGQKISASFVVDMDIFPHIIDQMGGIDFSFSQPLIDPTYKTNDNGKKGTLFFDKGTHHLSGIQALRVARSRHTTNDFSRAARQQEIISALRKNISQKNFLELLPLVKIVLQNTETDITPLYTSKILWKTRNYELRNGAVLSTSNILESQMIDVGQSIKAYALLPKNNNWESIKKFIWREIEK